MNYVIKTTEIFFFMYMGESVSTFMRKNEGFNVNIRLFFFLCQSNKLVGCLVY